MSRLFRRFICPLSCVASGYSSTPIPEDPQCSLHASSSLTDEGFVSTTEWTVRDVHFYGSTGETFERDATKLEVITEVSDLLSLAGILTCLYLSSRLVYKSILRRIWFGVARGLKDAQLIDYMMFGVSLSALGYNVHSDKKRQKYEQEKERLKLMLQVIHLSNEEGILQVLRVLANNILRSQVESHEQTEESSSSTPPVYPVDALIPKEKLEQLFKLLVTSRKEPVIKCLEEIKDTILRAGVPKADSLGSKEASE